MDVNMFDFHLPESLIAQKPSPDRTGSRLMTLNRKTGQIEHRQFSELIDLLQTGDCLVFNDTKVIPARLYGEKQGTGARIEALLLRDLGENRWEALVRPAKRVPLGTEIRFSSDDEADHVPSVLATVVEESDAGGRVLQFQTDIPFHEWLDRAGTMPLPPYIKEPLTDKDRYQTVYAVNKGSAAAPTAGLHFTQPYLQELEQKGIRLAFLTLHVGLGTFRPVTVDRVEDHTMHAEYYKISSQCVEQIEKTRAEGKRVIAVGTTSARTLESAAQQLGGNRLQAMEGWTDIFIYPGYQFQMIDALVTNFHLPRSTLLMMISAFAGREQVLQAYEVAIKHKYRFFSFGDAMFIY